MTLTRKTPFGRRPRARGNRGELEIRNLLHAHGWPHARRNFQSGGQGGGDIIDGPADLHVEVKYCETAQPWSWLRQAEGEARPTQIAAVFCRCNHMPWMVILPQHEWVALRALDQSVPVLTVVVAPGKRLQLWVKVNEALDAAGTAMLPQLVFSRAGSEVYSVVPAEELLRLIAIRERGA